MVLDGMVAAPSVYSQTTRPVRGWIAARPLPDWSTATVGPSELRRGKGEVQLAIFGRFNFHTFVPVFASSPALNDSLSFSSIAITTPSMTVSEEDMPRLLLALG